MQYIITHIIRFYFQRKMKRFHDQKKGFFPLSSLKFLYLNMTMFVPLYLHWVLPPLSFSNSILLLAKNVKVFDLKMAVFVSLYLHWASLHSFYFKVPWSMAVFVPQYLHWPLSPSLWTPTRKTFRFWQFVAHLCWYCCYCSCCCCCFCCRCYYCCCCCCTRGASTKGFGGHCCNWWQGQESRRGC